MNDCSRHRPAPPAIDVLLVFLIVPAAIWRFACIDRESFWLDEIMQVQTAKTQLLSHFFQAIPKDKPPFDYILIRTMLAFGENELLLRLPYALFGIGSVLSVLWFLWRWNHTFALSASFFLCISASHFYISCELVPYASSSFFLFLTFFHMHRMLSNGRTSKGMILLATSACLALLSNLVIIFSVFSILGIGLVVSITKGEKGHLRSLVIVSLAISVLYAFFVIRLATVGNVDYPWKFPTTLTEWRLIILPLLGGGVLGVAIGIILFVLGICGSLLEKPSLLLKMTLAWLFIGVVSLTIVFRIMNHWLPERYFVQFTLPVALIQARGLVFCCTKTYYAIRSLFAYVCIVLLTACNLSFSLRKLDEKLNYRGIVLAMRTMPAVDAVAVDSDVTSYCYLYYAKRIGNLPLEVAVINGKINSYGQLFGCERIFVFPLLFDGYRHSSAFQNLLKGGRVISGSTAMRLLATDSALSILDEDDSSLWKEEYLIYGWYAVESWGNDHIRWASSKSCIGFSCAGKSRRATISVDCFPLLTDGILSRHVWLEINGKRIADAHLEKAEFARIDSEEFDVAPDNILEVYTDSPPPVPAENRSISIAVRNVLLLPALPP